MAERTKIWIAEKMRKLMEKKSIEKIRVTEICRAAEIERPTFYYHFRDIPDLLESIVQEDCDQIIEDYPDIDSIESCLLVALDFARKRKKIISHIYNSADRPFFEKNLWKLCDYVVNNYLQRLFLQYDTAEEDRRLLGQYYKGVCFGITMEWLEYGMDEDVARCVNKLYAIKQGQLEEVFKRLKKY